MYLVLYDVYTVRVVPIYGPESGLWTAVRSGLLTYRRGQQSHYITSQKQQFESVYTGWYTHMAYYGLRCCTVVLRGG